MDELRKWRSGCGITQKQAAACIGVSQTAYSMWESGYRNVSKRKLTAVHKVTQIPLEQLLRSD